VPVAVVDPVVVVPVAVVDPVVEVPVVVPVVVPVEVPAAYTGPTEPTSSSEISTARVVATIRPKPVRVRDGDSPRSTSNKLVARCAGRLMPLIPLDASSPRPVADVRAVPLARRDPTSD
jgi:hypothetical protein